MRQYISTLCLLLSAAFSVLSCMSEDESSVTLYDDTAITEFHIASAKIIRHTLSSTGEDSTFIVTDETISSYPFSIDHLRGEIYNVDSLPLGTDAEKLLCSYYTKNNGYVLIENIMNDSVKYLSTTDSTDFRVPRYVQVHASDNSAFRRYRITVNVRQEEKGLSKWTGMQDCDDFKVLNDMRLLVSGNTLYAIGSTGVNTVVYTCDVTDGNTWTAQNIALGADIYNNVAARNDSLFILDGETVKVSVDGGRSFAGLASATGLVRLVGCGTSELHAIYATGEPAVSTDGGRTWTVDNIEADNAADRLMLPAHAISYNCSAFKFNENTDYAVMAVTRNAADEHPVMWRKIMEYGVGGQPGKWVNISPADSYSHPLPAMKSLALFEFGGNRYAVGLQPNEDGSTTQPSPIYESRDGGITWKSNTKHTLPEGIDSSATSIAVCTAGDGNIWIVCGGTGQVWRGRLGI